MEYHDPPTQSVRCKWKGNTTDLGMAIQYASTQGAKIVSMSLSSDPEKNLDCLTATPSLAATIEDAYNNGVLIITAAGNASGDVDKVIPANCPHVLTIGATDSSDQLATFSNTGNAIDLSAPGVSILSTSWPGGGYVYQNGTSMATPYVAGLAALVWAEQPTYTPDQVAAALLDNAVDLGSGGWDTEYGCGRIDAAGSVITGTQGSTSTCKPDVLSAAGPTQAVQSAEAPQTDSYLPGRLIVKWLDGPQLTADSTLTLERQLPDQAWLVTVPVGKEWELLQQLQESGSVEYVQLDYRLYAQ